MHLCKDTCVYVYIWTTTSQPAREQRRDNQSKLMDLHICTSNPNGLVVCMHVHTKKRQPNQMVWLYVCMYIQLVVCMHVHTKKRQPIQLVCLYVCMHIESKWIGCMYVCMCVCTYKEETTKPNGNSKPNQIHAGFLLKEEPIEFNSYLALLFNKEQITKPIYIYIYIYIYKDYSKWIFQSGHSKLEVWRIN